MAPNQTPTQRFVIPPFTAVREVKAMLAGTSVKVGAQNMHPAEGGAFTGEVSGAMLRELGCEYVIVGHSERRALYGETDERVAAKFGTAQSHGLKPILCVGETLEEIIFLNQEKGIKHFEFLDDDLLRYKDLVYELLQGFINNNLNLTSSL